MGNLQNGEEVHTDDKKSRDLVTDFVKKVYNRDVISNPEKFLIDLIFVDEPHVGIEIEEGQYYGDYWCNEKSLFLRNADPEVPFRTCNIPIKKGLKALLLFCLFSSFLCCRLFLFNCHFRLTWFTWLLSSCSSADFHWF
jgi:hypothetical protein